MEKYYQQFLESNPYPRKLFTLDIDNRHECVDFSSNDYLGLATHPALIERSTEYLCRWGVGAKSSRLVTGNLPCFEKIETKLALLSGKPAALIIGSGYQTNISVLEAILDTQVLAQQPIVFFDRYCHASMVRMTQHLAKIHRFQHNNLDHLEQLLHRYHGQTCAKFILAETIYSMDGDESNIHRLCDIAQEYDAMLYLDDAHSLGVVGRNGYGLASEHASRIDMIMGTFSKALGSYGGYVACSELMKDYLINKCSGLIYATGLSPAILGAIDAAIDLLPTLDKERQRVKKYADCFRDFMQQHHLEYGVSKTHIVPWIIGNADNTIRIANALRTEGIFAIAIRPPTVPINQSRIRFCFSAAHSSHDIEKLTNAIRKIL